MDSAKAPIYMDEEAPEKKISQKFIVGMTLIVVASIFTGMKLMEVSEWMLFTGAVGAAYFGVNVYQKKMLNQ